MVPKDRPIESPPAETGDTLADLLPAVRVLRIGNTDVRVRELTAEEMPAVVEAMRPMLAAIDQGSGDFLRIIPGALDPACSVAEATTGIAAATWRRAGLGKLAQVVKASVEVNLDFFVHGLGIGAAIAALMPRSGDGQTSSPTSPRTAIPGP